MPGIADSSVTIISAEQDSCEKIFTLLMNDEERKGFFTAKPFYYKICEKSLDEFVKGFPVQAGILYFTREEASLKYRVSNPAGQVVDGDLTVKDCPLLEPWLTQSLFVMDGFPGSEPIDFEQLDVLHGQVYVISGTTFSIVNKTAKTCVSVDVVGTQLHQLLAALNFENLPREVYYRRLGQKRLGQAELDLLGPIIGQQIKLPLTTEAAEVANVVCILKNLTIHLIYDEIKDGKKTQPHFLIDITEEQRIQFFTELERYNFLKIKCYKILGQQELTVVAGIINPILEAQPPTELDRITAELGRDNLSAEERKRLENQQSRLHAERRQHVGLPSVSSLSVILSEISKITQQREHTTIVEAEIGRAAINTVLMDIDRQERYLVGSAADLEYLVALWKALPATACYVQGGADGRVLIQALSSFRTIWRKFLLEFTGGGNDLALIDEKQNLTIFAFCYLADAANPGAQGDEKEAGAFAFFCKTGAPEVWMAFNIKRANCPIGDRIEMVDCREVVIKGREVVAIMPTMMIPEEVDLRDPSLGLTVSVVENSEHIPWDRIIRGSVSKVIPLFFNGGVCEDRVNLFNNFGGVCSRIHNHPALTGVSATYYDFEEVIAFLRNIDAAPAAIDHTDAVLTALRTEEFKARWRDFNAELFLWRTTTDSFLVDETKDHLLLVPNPSDMLERGQIHVTLPADSAANQTSMSSLNYKVMDHEGNTVTDNITTQDLPGLEQALNGFYQEEAVARKAWSKETESTRKRQRNALLKKHLQPLLLDILKFLSGKKHIEIENVRLLRKFSECCQSLIRNDESQDHHRHRRALMMLGAQYARHYEWSMFPSALGLEFLDKFCTRERLELFLQREPEGLKTEFQKCFNDTLRDSLPTESLELALLDASLQHLKSHLSEPQFLPMLSTQQREELKTLDLQALQQWSKLLSIVEENLCVVLFGPDQLTWDLVKLVLQPILNEFEKIVGAVFLDAQCQGLSQTFVDTLCKHADLKRMGSNELIKALLFLMTGEVFPACCTLLLEKINALSPENLYSVLLKRRLKLSFSGLLHTLKQELPWVVEYCGENNWPQVVANIERFPPVPLPLLLSDVTLQKARKSLNEDGCFKEALSSLERKITQFPPGKDVNEYMMLQHFQEYCSQIFGANVKKGCDVLRVLITRYAHWHVMSKESSLYAPEIRVDIEKVLGIVRRSLQAKIQQQDGHVSLVAAPQDRYEPQAGFYRVSSSEGAAAAAREEGGVNHHLRVSRLGFGATAAP